MVEPPTSRPSEISRYPGDLALSGDTVNSQQFHNYTLKLAVNSLPELEGRGAPDWRSGRRCYGSCRRRRTRRRLAGDDCAGLSAESARVLRADRITSPEAGAKPGGTKDDVNRHACAGAHASPLVFSLHALRRPSRRRLTERPDAVALRTPGDGVGSPGPSTRSGSSGSPPGWPRSASGAATRSG